MSPGYTPPFVQSVPDPNEIIAGIFDFNLPEDIFETYSNPENVEPVAPMNPFGFGILSPIPPPTGGITGNPSAGVNPNFDFSFKYDMIKAGALDILIWVAILILVFIGVQATISGDDNIRGLVNSVSPVKV